MFKDYFVEGAAKLSEVKSGELSELLRDLGTSISCTPSIQIDHHLHLTYCRISDLRRDETSFEERVDTALERLSVVSVANTFEELRECYERSAHYFVVDVKLADGSQTRLPLAELGTDEPVGGIARAPGSFLGGPDFQFSISKSTEKKSIREQVRRVSECVRGSNDLTEADRKDLLGYLEAIDAILTQSHPDKVALRFLLKRLADRAKRVALRLGERLATNEILELVKEVFGQISGL